MHTLKRFAVAAVLVVALVPLSTTLALIAPGERDSAERALTTAVERAAIVYRSRPQSALKTQHVDEAQARVQALAREKREVRLAIAQQRSFLTDVREQQGIDPANDEERTGLAEEERSTLLAFLRVWQLRNDFFFGSGTSAVHALRRILTGSLGELTENDMYDRIMQRSRMRLLERLAEAGRSHTALVRLEERHAELRQEYAAAQRTYHAAARSLQVGGSPDAEIRRVWEEVHQQVLRMQAELARIDARLRARAERRLIEKGLMAPKSGGADSGSISSFTPQFIWPAYGRISAGFADPDYEKIFGIPHRGMDIAIPQGSGVVSAADGVVFLARNGGDYGYSYVLIGHRGGYATLYGHLSHISVHAGQDVTAGQVIGASGGQPGTPGAGPTTTGPHLHFEVMKAGVTIDPQSILMR